MGCKKSRGLTCHPGQMCASCSQQQVWAVPIRSLLWGRRTCGQVSCPLMQSRLFTNVFLPALSCSKCSQFHFSKPVTSVLGYFLSLYSSSIYSTFEHQRKNNPRLLPSFCLPVLMKTLYKFESNLKYTCKFRQQFKCALARGQAGQGGQDSSNCKLSTGTGTCISHSDSFL